MASAIRASMTSLARRFRAEKGRVESYFRVIVARAGGRAS